MIIKNSGRFVMKERKCYYDHQVTGQVYCCAFHPTKPILVCALDEGEVRLFRDDFLSSSSPSWTLRSETRSHISCLAWSANGSHLAAGCFDGTVLLWPSNFKCNVISKRYHRMAVFAIHWGRWNPHLFATRTRDEDDFQRIFLWDADKNNLRLSRCYEVESKFVWDFEWISPTRLAACTFEGFIYVFHIGRNTPIKILYHPGAWRIVCHSANDLTSGSSDGSLKVWSVDKVDVKYQCQLPSKVYCFDSHKSQDEAIWIVCGLEDGSIGVWIPSINEPRNLDGHADAVFSVRFSPGGRYLSSIDAEEAIIIWSTESWEKVYEYLKPNWITWNQMSWDSEGRMLAISNSTSQVHVIELEEEVTGLAALDL